MFLYHMHIYEVEDKLPAIRTLQKRDMNTDILGQIEIFTEIPIITHKVILFWY